MLKRCYRLKRSKDFRRAYQKGKYCANPYLVVYYVRNDQGGLRIGFSVSKKIGQAVVRNRVKRQLREICRLNESIFPPGYDLVFVARAKIKEADYHLMQKNLLSLVARMKVKNNG